MYKSVTGLSGVGSNLNDARLRLRPRAQLFKVVKRLYEWASQKERERNRDAEAAVAGGGRLGGGC